MTEKPVYRVPTMEEIASIPTSHSTVASTFSGCGGSSLGYKMAGLRVLWANEFVEAARDTYRANQPDTILDPRDIRAIQPEEILDAIGLQKGELDILDGSPPCASFSTAGRREKDWGKVKTYSETAQRVDNLFFEFVRILDGVKPRVFVAENVYGLVKGTAKGWFLDILKSLKQCGYKVKAALLDAQWLGVPQMRQRIIFVGVREDLCERGIGPSHPAPLKYRYGVNDACPEITEFSLCTGDEKNKWIMVWRSSSYPFATLTQSIGGKSHFVKDRRGTVRRPTIDELKALCGFPSDFILTGTYRQQWERLGRAVPPLMMYQIAKTVREDILCKL